jgi:hydrogenase 3 maturation protease
VIRLFGRTLSGRIVVAGVGRVDRRDDGAGPVLARRLASVQGVQTVDCGDRLEDFTADIARLRPDILLVADAVDLHAAPGSLALLEARDLPAGINAHDGTLRAAMEYLKARAHADVLLLAIQPGEVRDGVGLSAEVGATVDLLVDLFRV